MSAPVRFVAIDVASLLSEIARIFRKDVVIAVDRERRVTLYRREDG